MSAGYDDRVRAIAAAGSGGRRRSQSWWGRAWIASFEAAATDAESLKRGRACLYAGRVGAVTVSPGRIAAPVRADDGSSYDAVVRIGRLTDENWDRFVAEIAVQSGYIAALLDGDMPAELATAADDVGVPLLPGPDELEPECTCDELDVPCRHAAALCYQLAALLDDDPFLLLLMRGRAQSELLEQLQQRAGAAGSEPRETQLPLVATTARDAYAASAVPLPPDPPMPTTAPPRVTVPSALGVDARGIEWLVADAALRAHAWLATGEPPEHLDGWRDTVRLAASHGDPRLFARLRGASDRGDELPRAARAWQYGAAAGLDVLENPRSLTRAELVAATVSIAGAWDDEDAPAFAVSGNRWTLVGRGLQLRYGRGGSWYPYRDESGEWWPAGAPQTDPAIALADLL